MCVELKKDYILEMSKSRSILGFAVPLQYFAKAQQLHSSRQGTIHILRKKVWGKVGILSLIVLRVRGHCMFLVLDITKNSCRDLTPFLA